MSRDPVSAPFDYGRRQWQLLPIMVTGAGLDPVAAATAEAESRRTGSLMLDVSMFHPDPFDQVLPLLTLARLAAAFAAHFGEPRFIDLVAAAARQHLLNPDFLDLDAVQKEVP